MKLSTRTNVVSAIILCVILVLAAFLRFDRARADGLTFDEIWHVELSTGRGSPQITLPTNVLIPDAPAVTSLTDAPPIWNAWSRMEGVVHPPLFVTILRIWRSVFGESDVAAKSLSITCALIAIVLLHDALRTQGSIGAARWAALIFAVAPSQIYLSQQVRGYAMAQMFACGVIAAVVRIESLGPNRWRLIALALAAAALALTHYFGILALLAIALYVLVRLRDRTRRDTLLALAAAGAIFLLAWGPFIWRLRGTISRMADPWLTEASVPPMAHLRLTLGRMLALPVRQIAEPTNAALNWPLIVGALLIVVAIVLLVRRRRAELLIWLIWLGGTLLAVMLLDLFRHTQQLAFPRYTSLAAPGIFAIVAIVRPPKHVLPILAAIFALILYPTAFVRDGEPDWRALGRAIDKHTQRDEPLIFYSGGQVFWYHQILFLGTSHYSHTWPRPIVRLTTTPADDALVASLPSQTPWLVSGPLDRPIEQVIPGAQMLEQRLLPNLALLTRVQLPARRR